MNIGSNENSFQYDYGEQYAITLQFQLQREKEKNKILQERLRNKQIFIVQMKKMHSEMQMLNERCRAELQQQRQARNTLQNVTLRQYAETIAQLQHKIGLLQSLDGAYYKEAIQKHYPKIKKSKSTNRIQKKPDIQTQQKAKQKQEQVEVLKKFTKRFLEMYFYYSKQNEDISLKRQLKTAWKWIKGIVQDWQDQEKVLNLIGQYAQYCKQNQQKCDPVHLLNLKHQNLIQDDEN